MEHRSSPRTKTVLKAEIRYNDGLMRVPCLLRDISETGARLELGGDIALPDQFDLYIEKKHQTHHAVIKRRSGRDIGVAFEDATAKSEADEPGLPERMDKLEADVAELKRTVAEIADAVRRQP